MVLYETNSRIFSMLCTSKHFWCWRIAKKETLKHKIENVCARNERTVLALEAKKMKRANPKNIYLNERKSTRTLKWIERYTKDEEYGDYLEIGLR